jgi:hypothetical protein
MKKAKSRFHRDSNSDRRIQSPAYYPLLHGTSLWLVRLLGFFRYITRYRLIHWSRSTDRIWSFTVITRTTRIAENDSKSFQNVSKYCVDQFFERKSRPISKQHSLRITNTCLTQCFDALHGQKKCFFANSRCGKKLKKSTTQIDFLRPRIYVVWLLGPEGVVTKSASTPGVAFDLIWSGISGDVSVTQTCARNRPEHQRWKRFK